MFRALHTNGYVVERSQLSAIDPSTGRGLPDRYVEGTCPICGYDGARGDQCDNCGNQLDPQDLVNPRSKIDGKPPQFVESAQFFLELPAFVDALGSWLQTREGWRPNVLAFSKNLVDDLKPRAITRDLDWGVPVPLPGWQDRGDKRLYVWFDAVIGYLSASVEWARRSGEPEAWREFWSPESESYYFMGKDNVVFHSVIWPSILLGAPGPAGVRRPRRCQRGRQLSEFLTMEGRKFSSSRSVVIYVRDVLERYGADALRYYLAAAGPESSDTDFTWEQFVTRNNTELVGGVGQPRQPHGVDGGEEQRRDPGAGRAARRRPRGAGRLAGRLRPASGSCSGATSRRRPSARRCASSARPTGTWPTPRRGSSRRTSPRRDTVLHVALQLVDDAKTLLTPFLPDSSDAVHALLGGTGRVERMPELQEVEDLDGGPGYPVLTGDYAQRRRGLGVAADHARHADRAADAAVPQARPVGGRRGAGAARGGRSEQEHRNGAAGHHAAAAPEPLAVPVAGQPLPPRHRRRPGRTTALGRRARPVGRRRGGAGRRRPAVVALGGGRGGRARRRRRGRRAAPERGRARARRPTRRCARSRRWPRCRRSPPWGRPGSTTTARRPRAGPRRRSPSGRTSPSPSGTARRWSSTTATATTTSSACCCRRARPDRVVFHCFSGGPDLARTCAEHGWAMSFAGPVTFKPNDDLRAAAALAPAELLLVETDAPFLTPVPHRGRPNAPYLVPLTVRALAAARGRRRGRRCAPGSAANGRRLLGV